MNEIIAAIAALKTERETAKARIAQIDQQLAEIAGSLPRRRRAKDEPKSKAPRKAKQPAAHLTSQMDNH